MVKNQDKNIRLDSIDKPKKKLEKNKKILIQQYKNYLMPFWYIILGISKSKGNFKLLLIVMLMSYRIILILASK